MAKDLPTIPNKLYFTIGEVGTLCGVKPHVLRFWEQEFPLLKPVKRRGNRRYYRKQEIITIREIRRLLHDEGYTIKGARHRLKARSAAPIASKPTKLTKPGIDRFDIRADIRAMCLDLESVLRLLDSPGAGLGGSEISGAEIRSAEISSSKISRPVL